MFVPLRLRRFLAEQNLSESHLKNIVRKKAVLLVHPGGKKMFPVKAGNTVRFDKLPVTHIPVVERHRVVGVVELIGGLS